MLTDPELDLIVIQHASRLSITNKIPDRHINQPAMLKMIDIELVTQQAGNPNISESQQRVQADQRLVMAISFSWKLST